MDKHTPHYPLQEIQLAVGRLGIRAFTSSARTGLRGMGLTDQQALLVLASLSRKDFYKSMTTLADHRLWQDVYHAPTPCGMAYVKFTLREDGAIVISFKRL